MSAVTLESFEKSFPEQGALELQIRALLTGAMRAPSTHNSQPWRFRIVGNSVEVFRDERVKLPNSDKDTQYAHVSIGFLLHHIYVLAMYLGMQPDISVAGGMPLATVRLSAAGKSRDTSTMTLANALFERRNRRGVFTATKIPDDLLARLAAVQSLPPGLPPVVPAVITDQTKAVRIGELTLKTMERVYERTAFRAEMSRWIVPTGSARKDGIPGYSLNLPRPLSWLLPMMIRSFNIGKLPGKASAAALASAPAIFAFGADNDPRAWLAIGFTSSRIILALTAEGYDASVFVATAELPDIREEVTRLCGLTEPLRFLFAAGQLEGAADWQTPRVPLEDKLMP